MTKPKFSVVMIAKNEAKTLPKCLASLKEFTNRGGEVILCDTGSTDGTADIARSLGCKVTEVGEKFITVIDKDLADKINSRFVIGGETPIVKEGNRLFDFASARNFATALASNLWVSTMDCDEVFSVFDIDKINDIISNEKLDHIEYQFCFAHDNYGRPAIQFVQSKMFRRDRMKWIGCVHEVLTHI